MGMNLDSCCFVHMPPQLPFPCLPDWIPHSPSSECSPLPPRLFDQSLAGVWTLPATQTSMLLLPGTGGTAEEEEKGSALIGEWLIDQGGRERERVAPVMPGVQTGTRFMPISITDAIYEYMG